MDVRNERGRGVHEVVVGEEGELRTEVLVAALAADLARTTSGIAFIYDALHRLVTRLDLRDAVVVVDGEGAGLQAFHAGRRGTHTAWSVDRATRRDPGLYTDPVLLDPDTAEAMTNLCTIALRMDVLAHDAGHDPLTGLLNRRAFDELLARAVSRSVRYGWGFTLVLLDINKFKALNDRLGHLAGDDVLRAVGRGLQSFLRVGDVAARIGGDEFAVIVDGTDREVGAGLAARLTATVGGAVTDAGVGFSVGSATAPDEATDVNHLIDLADKRLYAGKGR